jgi:hypothetical protein
MGMGGGVFFLLWVWVWVHWRSAGRSPAAEKQTTEDLVPARDERRSGPSANGYKGVGTCWVGEKNITFLAAE